MARINANSNKVESARQSLKTAIDILNLQQNNMNEIIQYIDSGWKSPDAAELESCVRLVKKKTAKVNGFIKTSSNGLWAGQKMIEAAEMVMLSSK